MHEEGAKGRPVGKVQKMEQGEMAKSNDGGPSVPFLAICKHLDAEMAESFVAKAWKQYDTVGKQCVLEVSLDVFGCMGDCPLLLIKDGLSL